ncbi:MAG: pectate lyase [Bacteroidales bacterium]|nr:pectate lyase [Bacteroidales bacterium]
MKTLFKITLSLLLAGCIVSSVWAQRGQTTEQRILAAVKQATAYMLDEVSYKGGFVQRYLPDFSRQWGEMEAYRTMACVQPETPMMGEFFLDLYNATGDEYYYQAAEKVAAALIWGQHPKGGWNYWIDFAGETSMKQWYNTIGKHGWRLEEMQHYYGNSTFDDDATAGPARFILRLYTMRHDPKYLASIDKTINLLLESQYPIGGWPQRYPLMYDYTKNGLPDYSSFITFNDDVHQNNIELLMLYYRVLGKKELLDPILRAMHTVIALQQGMPQPGWGDQYSLDYKPAHGRTYEPRSLHPRTTGFNVNRLMDFYQLTGETKYLARIPEAIDWLETLGISDEHAKFYRGNQRGVPGVVVSSSYIEIGTNKPLYGQRRGSNPINGRYDTYYEPPGTFAAVNTQRLRERYNHLITLSVEEATKDSELKSDQPYEFATYVTMRRINSRNPNQNPPTLQDVNNLIASMKDGKYWLVPMTHDSHPYIGQEGAMEIPDDYVLDPIGQVGDKFDTSPFPIPAGTPQTMVITTRSYIQNVSRLMAFLQK